MKRLLLLPAIALFLAACAETTQPVETQKPTVAVSKANGPRTLEEGKASFARVSKRLLPVATSACRQIFKTNTASRCTFRLLISGANGTAPDARFTRNRAGRPIIVFNHAMLRFLRDDNEMAMVLGHEMAHQLGNHIERGQREVLLSAINSAAAAKKRGGNVEQAAVSGAENALVTYSQKFELEADRAGTILMMRAGYVPDQAILLLDRLPTSHARLKRHPPRSTRKKAVLAMANQVRAAARSGNSVKLAF